MTYPARSHACRGAGWRDGQCSLCGTLLPRRIPGPGTQQATTPGVLTQREVVTIR